MLASHSLRRRLPNANALTVGERQLLSEWLERIARPWLSAEGLLSWPTCSASESRFRPLLARRLGLDETRSANTTLGLVCVEFSDTLTG
jgi:hypothetical protein